MASHGVDVLLMYVAQGCTQGLAFATVPMQLGRNAAATDADQAYFSLVGYPFSLKFIIAPLVDAIYWNRIGKRESWLIPLQAISSLLLALLAGSADAWLKETPPAVDVLVKCFLVMTAATAAQDIATDALAADHLEDGTASSCQLIGLTLGFQISYSGFYALSGRGYLDFPQLLQIIAALNVGLLGLLLIRTTLRQQGAEPERAGEGDQADQVHGVGGVMQFVWALMRDTPNFRMWIAFLILVPTLDAPNLLLGLRYQELGFSPELFAEYDLYMVPAVLAASVLSGRLAQASRPLTVLVGAIAAGGVLNIFTLLHFWRCQSQENAIDNATLRWVYIMLTQVSSLVGNTVFVLKFAFSTRLAARTQAATATVITFLASISNLGGTAAGTWFPYAVDGASGVLGKTGGFGAVAAASVGAGLLGLLLFSGTMHRIEDLNAPGWA